MLVNQKVINRASFDIPMQPFQLSCQVSANFRASLSGQEPGPSLGFQRQSKWGGLTSKSLERERRSSSRERRKRWRGPTSEGTPNPDRVSLSERARSCERGTSRPTRCGPVCSVKTPSKIEPEETRTKLKRRSSLPKQHRQQYPISFTT